MVLKSENCSPTVFTSYYTIFQLFACHKKFIPSLGPFHNYFCDVGHIDYLCIKNLKNPGVTLGEVPFKLTELTKRQNGRSGPTYCSQFPKFQIRQPNHSIMNINVSFSWLSSSFSLTEFWSSLAALCKLKSEISILIFFFEIDKIQ